MKLSAFEYLEPKSLAEACSILAEYGDRVRVTAGGTDILPRMKQGLFEPQYLMSIKRIEEISAIQETEEGLRIGSAVTLANIHKSVAVQGRAPILSEAAMAVGATQLQNMGTVGGNVCLETRCWYYQQDASWRQSRSACIKLGGEICHMAKGSKRCYALYSGDTAAALLAIGGKARLVSLRGERILPLEDFYIDDGKSNTVRLPDELLAEVMIPAQPDGQAGTYLKFRKRGAIDFPIVGVGAVLTTKRGLCQQVRVAVTGVGSAPFAVKGVEDLLIEKELTSDLIEQVAALAFSQAKPVSHMEVSAVYRKQLVRVLVKDALCKLTS